MTDGMTRRDAVRMISATAAGMLLPVSVRAVRETLEMVTRAIPSSGEKLPVIGLGTSRVFDVDPSQASTLEPVLSELVKLGGRVIDSSPMYGHAEEVVGELVSKLKLRDSVFLATKVWTRGKQAGIDSMERSFRLLQTKTIDLMQVHNLVDTTTQLATMRDWKAQRRIRYLGITHYNSSAYSELERVLRSERVDFVQINYSLSEPEAEQRILPLAQERGVAVIVNRPFGAGDLFARVRGKPLPDFAREFDCTSWAQFMLKWIIAYPAVTCAIPATDKPEHMEDNLRAGSGRLPDAPMRSRMAEYVARL
ncbi:MAG: aldo/keto reductase [Verrucomicrobia bacterium]|nr:aldo/keto reductase [Verrucomicrobiota bacterium]